MRHGCATCGDGGAELFALRDYEEESGPYCLACALESLAEAHAVTPDGAALTIGPAHCPCWAWSQAGGTDRNRQDDPPSWVADGPTWDRAKAAVAVHWEHYQNPWSVVAATYLAMGGHKR